MKKTILWSMLAFLSFIVYGCGSGDFSTGATISGMASKGPITGAKVAIFAVTSSGYISTQLATATTSNGTFSANIGSYTGAIFATMSGSSASYTDETSNATTTLGATRLHAATVITAGGSSNLAITPFTELACQLAGYNQNAATPTLTNIVANNNLVSTSFNLPNIITTLPANILKTASAVTTPDTINYSLALAAFSELINSSSSTIAAGVSQLGTAVTNLNTNPNSVQSVWKPAVSSLATNNNIQSGLLSVPVAIAFSPLTYSAIISQPITIIAKVTAFDDTPVATGTTVTFTTNNGSLTTPTATDSNGNATVVLTPSAIGPATVNASVTISGVTVSTSIPAVVTVVKDPNDPGTVTLSSSVSGVAATSAVVGQTMTLTTNVGVVGGGPNSVTPGTPPNPAATVTFTIVHGSGTLTSGSSTSTSSVTATTDANGNAVVTLTSAAAGNITLSANAVNSTTGTSKTSSPLTVAFTPNPSAPATVTVSASSTSSAADGITPVTFTIKVTNYAGTALPSVPLTIGASAGTLSATTATTDSNGNATVTLTSSTVGSATVTVSAIAAAVTATGTAQVNFTTPPARPTTAIVTVYTSGTLASGVKIGGIQATLTYPTTKGLSVSTTSPPVASGVGSGQFFSANSNNPGDVIFDLATTTGITTGAFATITFTIPTTGTLPVTGDFAIASAATGVTGVSAPIIDDTNGSTISGISVITTVTFQ